MSPESINQLSSYKDVNEVLTFFSKGIEDIFKKNLVGLYLTGSLSHNAFNYDSSDIDLTVILRKPVSSQELSDMKSVHQILDITFNKWSRRLECSYIPVEVLPSILPPKKPRPWYWGGENILYPEAPYGNEWLINNYLL